MQASQCFLLGMLLARSPASYFYYDWKGFPEVVRPAIRSLWHRRRYSGGSGGLQTWLSFSEVLDSTASQQSLQPDMLSCACSLRSHPLLTTPCPPQLVPTPVSPVPQSSSVPQVVDSSDLPSSPQAIITS